MEINYQTKLRDNLIIPRAGEMTTGSGYLYTCKPLNIDEILLLESNYNSGNKFPASLRELLFLAGQGCHVLDYGIFDTQIDIQDGVREELVEYQWQIERPFFVIDVNRGPIPFLFVYLDQPTDDPPVYIADLGKKHIHGNPEMKIRWINFNLSSFVNDRIEDIKKGWWPY